MSFLTKEEKTSYIYLAIPFVCVAFVLGTIGYLFIKGWGTFGELFSDWQFWNALIHNMLWLFWAVTVPIGLGLLFATLLSKDLKGERVFKGIIYFPALLAGAAVGLAWQWFYRPDFGALNSIIDSLGLGFLGPPRGEWVGQPFSPPLLLLIIAVVVLSISIAFLLLAHIRDMPDFILIIISIAAGVGVPVGLTLTGDLTSPLLSILLASTWPATAMSMVVFLADMRNIPQSLLEAAEVDGASGLQSFRHVILPSLKSSFNIMIVLSAIGAMRVFSLVIGLVGYGGGINHSVDVLAVYIYRVGFQGGQMAKASAAGFMGIVVSAVPVFLYLLLMKRREEENRR